MKNQTTLKVANSIQHHCLKSNSKTEKKKETPWKRKFVYFAWEKDLLVDGRPALLSENTAAFRQSSNFPFDSGCRPVTLKANFSSWSGQKGNAKRVREERRRVRDASKSVLTMEGPGHEYEGVTEGSWNSRWKGWTRKRITKWTSRRRQSLGTHGQEYGEVMVSGERAASDAPRVWHRARTYRVLLSWRAC